MATMLAIPAAAAGDGLVTKPATYSACPTGAAPAAGFTDVVAGSTHAANIDCIKYYGVTQGTSATTYSPAQAVTRWQMALFLTRAAGPSGITLGDGSDQGFTDISGLPAATQVAINQLAQSGISKGTSATTFDPNGIVSRWQMALFISRFLDAAIAGPGGTQPKGYVADDAPFTDVSSVSVEAYTAINDLYELGVTTGTTATTFSPYAAVTRDQMASFISRGLNHTNARPSGVWIQTDAADGSGYGAQTPALSVTHRDSSFLPVPNTLIDVFEFTTATGKTAFKTDGTCTADSVNVATALGTACKIDLIDFSTNSNGNLATIAESVADGGTVTYYAWTGATGATFDNDTTTSSSVVVSSITNAQKFKVTTSIATNTGTVTEDPAGDAPNATYKNVKFGETVTVTAQLRDAAATPANVAKANVSVIFTRSQYDKTGALVSTTSTTVKTDSTGKATFGFSQSDPSATAGEAAWDVVTVTSTGLTQEGTGSPVNVKWLDATSAVTKLVLSQDIAYTVASGTGSGATHTAKGTVYDQYGATKSGVGVQFSNDNDAELLTPVTRYTDSAGVATLTWARVDAASESDTVSGVADVDGDGNFTVGAGEAIDDTADLTVYWVLELADDGTSGGAKTVKVWDAANDALVYNPAGDTYTLVYYDSNDQFTLAAATTYALFDAAVAAEPLALTYTNVNVTTYKQADSSVSAFDLG